MSRANRTFLLAAFFISVVTSTLVNPRAWAATQKIWTASVAKLMVGVPKVHWSWTQPANCMAPQALEELTTTAQFSNCSTARGSGPKSSFTASRITPGTVPVGNLVFDKAGNSYGTTYSGGSNFSGTVFRLTPSSNGTWTETILYNFGAVAGEAAAPLRREAVRARIATWARLGMHPPYCRLSPPEMASFPALDTVIVHPH